MFPELGPTGGIENSGRLAWQAIVEHNGQRKQAVYMFCYGRKRNDTAATSASAKKRMLLEDTSPFAICVPSKAGAIVAAFRRRWPVDNVLIWHLGLLKLLPFFRLPQARVILFLHGIEIWAYRSWLDRSLLRRVDLFLSNSDFTWQEFLKAHPSYASAAHQTVHLGIGAPLDGRAPLPESRPIALMISRLRRGEDYKGHREMIAAWPGVLERTPDAELWIAGEGDLRAELERAAASLGLQGRVKFWGRVSEEKKQEMLARCRCLALPSRAEGFGLVYLEAMRMGRPCLVSTVDAGREVVNPPEAGLAADPNDSRALVEAISELLTPGPEWNAWSRRARARYEAHFTARHFQDRLVAALERFNLGPSKRSTAPLLEG
jgi:phosphatidylinositol alpha-1,6-mannosyltransferase